jgi:L-arabinose isomerase
VEPQLVIRDSVSWVLPGPATGSQHLYGEETLRQVAAQSQAIAGVLACSSSTRRRPRAFENELRWNAAYYRLARGI